MVSLVNNRKVTKTLLKYQIPSTCHCIIPCLVLMKTFWQIASGGKGIHFSLEFESGYSPQWWRGHGTKYPRLRNRMLASHFILTQEIEGEEGGKEERRETETEKAQECRKYSWVRKPQHPSPVRDCPEQCPTTKGWKTMSSPEDQLFKYMKLWGTFLVQTTTATHP